MGPLRRRAWTLHARGVRNRGSLCGDSSARLPQRAGASRGAVQQPTSAAFAGNLFIRQPDVVDRTVFPGALRSAASDCACGCGLVARTRTPLGDQPYGVLARARVLFRDTTRLLRAQLRTRL